MSGSSVTRGDIALAVIGDIHGNLTALRQVVGFLSHQRVAGVLLVGDFASPSYERRARRHGHDLQHLSKEVAEALEIVNVLGVDNLWVPGNHDLKPLDLPANCDGQLLELAGIQVFGIGGAGPDHFGFPYEWTEDEIERIHVPKCDVLLSHTPPVQTELDFVYLYHRHVGSRAIRNIASAQSKVLVCGHIHEASGVDQIGDCLCLNVGSLGAPYGRPQVGFVTFNDQECKVAHRNLETGHTRELACRLGTGQISSLRPCEQTGAQPCE